MPDCEVGAFIQKEVDKEFDKDFKRRPNDYVDGKVTAKMMRSLFTHSIDRVVTKLYTHHKPMIKRAFQKTGVMIDLDGYDKNLIRVPRFATYKPPE